MASVRGFAARAAVVGIALLLCAASTLALVSQAQPARDDSTHDVVDDPIVTTSCGAVRGATANGVSSYLGIPFAAPPVGSLRWKPPISLADADQCWAGTFPASDFGSGCAQAGVGGSVYGSEDCLYLNVWSPATATSTSKLPVLVFIYGGSLVSGDSRWYPQGELAATGEAVAVSINYRVNGFGFMALPGLGKVDPRGVSGNYGFLDQQLGLKWVQDNIAAFGGDPTRVTVWGQSSGGTSVLALLASPASRGLFHRVMSLSGSPNITADLAFAEHQNEGFIRSADCDSAANTTACLLALTTEQVFDALPDDVWGGEAQAGQGGLPTAPGGEHYPAYAVVDGVTLVAPVDVAMRQGLVDVPLMVGSMAQELDLGPNKVVYNYTLPQWDAWLATHFEAFGADFGAQVGDKYAAGAAENPQKAYDSIGTDTGVTCGNIEVAKAAGEGFQSPVFSYVNNYAPSHLWPSSPTGYACHYAFHELDMMSGLEGWSWFHDYGDPPKPPPYVPSKRDSAYGAMMRRVWLTFAATGTLQPLGWHPISSAPNFPQHYTTAVLNTTVVSVVDLRADLCSWWASRGIGQGYWWTN